MKIHNHSRICRVLALMLGLLLVLLSLASCKQPVEPPVVDTRLNFLSNNGVSIYRIVYPEQNCTRALRESAEGLKAAMEHMLGVEVAITDDHGSLNATDQLQPYEILIGQTAREETQRLLPEVSGDSYLIKVVGHKIVILGATNRATITAVNEFIATVIGYDESAELPEDRQIKIENNYEKRGAYTHPLVRSEAVETTLPKAPYRATVLYTIERPEDPADALMLATLQGLSTLLGSDQIYMRYGDTESMLEGLVDMTDVTIADSDDIGRPWTPGRLLNQYADRLDGYLLCADDLSDESVGVAISLANQLNAVVVTSQNEAVAQAAGLSMILDVRGKDDAWLRSTLHFDRMRKTVAIEMPADSIPVLVDYAVMTGAYYYDYRGGDEYMHLQMFRYLDDGALLLTAEIEDHGSNPNLAFETIGVTPYDMPAPYVMNLSVISGTVPAQWEAALFGEE